YVLKAAIRLLRARFPRGTSGSHLDTMARSVLWDFAHVYNHGTGHGVGISVHESPPKISGISFDRIEEGMVFSVEPGIYIEGYGGVRIENLVTVVADSEYDSWLRIEPLTFCPLDKRLIDVTYLDSTEREWLRDYQKKYAGSS
ncbi:MAG: M24 family metallopeptidase, partial [Spirochaetota bacterium]|nr:M24 family metallopeptidase [Spirochaetota bacterium]